MTAADIEATRKCPATHGGPHSLDAMSSAGEHFECRGCGRIYSKRQAEQELTRVAGLNFRAEAAP